MNAPSKELGERLAQSRPDIPEKISTALNPVILKLFSEKDFHQVKIKELADLSGISTATIYKYFSSKENLVVRTLEYHIIKIFKQLNIHIKGLESTREKCRKAFWVVLDYYDRHPGLAIIYFITLPLKTCMENEVWMNPPGHEILHQIIALGQERGELDPQLSEMQMMSQFFMHLGRTVQVWYFHGMNRDLVDSIDHFFPVFWKTISI